MNFCARLSKLPATQAYVAGDPAVLVVTQLLAADSPREHLLLDLSWKFRLGDDWPDALSFVSSGTGSGPAAGRFADSYWRVVNLPHDWAIELPFDPTADAATDSRRWVRSIRGRALAELEVNGTLASKQSMV